MCYSKLIFPEQRTVVSAASIVHRVVVAIQLRSISPGCFLALHNNDLGDPNLAVWPSRHETPPPLPIIRFPGRWKGVHTSPKTRNTHIHT